MPYNQLSTQRNLSIDAFRGITILIMIFVNELAGIRDIPRWMQHMPAEADAMSFVDVVFPAFLFIVGMSVPFAINNRLNKGDTIWQLELHIVFRTIGLLTLGFFLVNTEGEYDETVMGMSINLWALLFFAAVILIWKIYYTSNKAVVYILKSVGCSILILLAFIYRREDGGHITARWWGILGLIGWAYLYSCIAFQVCKGNKYLLVAFIVLCMVTYVLGQQSFINEYYGLRWMHFQSGNAILTSIVLCGIVVSLIFFEHGREAGLQNRFLQAVAFTIVLIVAAYLLRPYYEISKIRATPSWALYSSAICSSIFMVLYWVTDRKQINKWTTFFKPAAANPLLTYIIPDIIYFLTALLGVSLFPDSLRYGLPGLLWSLIYAIAVMGIAMLLSKIKIRLQL